MDHTQLQCPDFPADEDAMINSTRIRVARNLADYPLGTCVTAQQRREIESKVVSALLHTPEHILNRRSDEGVKEVYQSPKPYWPPSVPDIGGVDILPGGGGQLPEERGYACDQAAD